MTSVEGALRTPLVDYFRRGEAPVDVRMLAARGVLAPRAHEQLELLVLLLKDSDTGVAEAAAATLESIPADALGAFLARADVSAELRSFFAARGVAATVAAAPGDEPLIDTAPEPPPAPENEDSQSTLQRIAAMTIAQRIGLAMKGSRE